MTQDVELPDLPTMAGGELIEQSPAEPLTVEAPNDEQLAVGRWFHVSERGLSVQGKPSFEAWARCGRALRAAERGLGFAIGDYIILVEHHLGERASQLIDSSDWAEATVRAYRWLSESVLPENREPRLSIRHHQAVAKMPPAEQRHWLQKSIDGDNGEQWTSERLRKEIHAKTELVENAWFLTAEFQSAEDRDKVAKELELQGHACKTWARRE